MNPHPSPGHIVLSGPTASGKSWLAMQLAEHLPQIELVSVDSMQVYRGMDIGTAKPTPQDRLRVRHHMIDLVDPSEDFGVTEFKNASADALADIESRGKRALLVGGTPLYIKAIVDDLVPPGRFPEVLSRLEADPDTTSHFERLRRLDPVSADRMNSMNRRRVLRALEVTLGSGRPFSSFGPGMAHYPKTSFYLCALWQPREVARLCINERVDQMIAAGWGAEVAHLRRPASLSRTASQALGYKELLAVRDLDLPIDKAIVDVIKARTRSFARRQRMWLRRDPRYRWYAAPRHAEQILPALLADFRTWLEADKVTDEVHR